MDSFSESGRFSKAWWIKLIRDECTQGGGIWYITEVAHTTHTKAKAAIDALVQGGYIEMLGKGGKSGYRYEVKSFGHRYLNEHYHELAEPHDFPVETPVPAVAPIVHGVPITPTTPMTTIRIDDMPPAHDDCQYCGKIGRACARHGGLLSQSYLNRQKNLQRVSGSNPIIPIIPTKTLPQVADESKTSSLLQGRIDEGEDRAEPSVAPAKIGDTLTTILGELLIEKYGDQITARELITAVIKRDL